MRDTHTRTHKEKESEDQVVGIVEEQGMAF